ncbi:MAG: FMN-binding protein [Planctomycetota bacterium]|nr:MAG: FMN-binding protein [Planctomycetota bacterium]
MIPLLIALLPVLLPPAPGGGGKVFLTPDEALALAFPKARIEKKTHYLTAAQRRAAEKAAGAALPSAVVRSYTARDAAGRLLGTAWFDRHLVRTKAEVLMVVVAPDRKVARVEILSFAEPLDYLPKGPWYAQFRGRELGPRLALRKDIRPISGATLSARATVAAVRRVLAVHAAVFPPPPPEQE